MARTATGFMLERLSGWGIERIYRYQGTKEFATR
jgi:hypothetical protein